VQFEQFYLGCLAHASYLIASEGEAAVVDPQRDVDQYIESAARMGARIRYVVETHLHADFVSGHRELAERTGAEIVFGEAAAAEFPHRAVREGDELRIGGVVLRAIATPGHTPESVCWLVTDTASPDASQKLLTGDTLFIGDVGRPDLAGGRGYTSQQMASMLYDSVHGKLLKLGDDVEVWPAHGAGSSCGRNISSDRSSTIGLQRRINYALQPMERDAFVAMMTTDLPPAPRYFAMDAEINRRGARALHEVDAPGLSPQDVARRIGEGELLLDVRDNASFAAGHVPGAFNIGLSGQFASWAGTLLSPEQGVVVAADDDRRGREAVMRLARVGLENVSGLLRGGMDAWQQAGQEVATLLQIDVGELRSRLGGLRVVDVRRPVEFATGHVPGALNVPLSELPDRVDELDPAQEIAVVCAGGYRSSIAASILQRHSFVGLRNVIGGTSAWLKAGFETE